MDYKKAKAKSLTIRLENKYSSEPDTVRIWEIFSQVAHYWFKHRKDGPAWVSKRQVCWYENGRLVHSESYIPYIP